MTFWSYLYIWFSFVSMESLKICYFVRFVNFYYFLYALSLDYHVEVRDKPQFRILEPPTPPKSFQCPFSNQLSFIQVNFIWSWNSVELKTKGSKNKSNKNKDKNISKEKKDGQNSVSDNHYDILPLQTSLDCNVNFCLFFLVCWPLVCLKGQIFDAGQKMVHLEKMTKAFSVIDFWS